MGEEEEMELEVFEFMEAILSVLKAQRILQGKEKITSTPTEDAQFNTNERRCLTFHYITLKLYQ